MKQNDYEHSRPLEVHRWSEHKEVNYRNKIFHSLFYSLFKIQGICLNINCLDLGDGAAEKTRTSTDFTPQRPQRCASTSSATAALICILCCKI